MGESTDTDAMPGLGALDYLREEITAAHCTACDRSADLSLQGDSVWCGFCGRETRVALRRMHVLREDTARAHATGDQFIDPQHVPLQPLRNPAGWRVAYHGGLYAVQPTEATVQWWWIFKQDMLSLVHDQRKRLLDLGWSPEMDFADGCYRLVLYEGGYDGRELHVFETRDLDALVAEIERILEQVANGRL